MPLSTTPVWAGGRLQPRPMTLRVFVAATKDDGYVVMPGGLTRVSGSRDARAIALHRGDGTKDTWVLSDEPDHQQLTLLRSPLSYVRPKRTGKDLPSRAADNLFWLGRNAERTEDIMRVLRSVVRRLTEDASPADNVAAMLRGAPGAVREEPAAAAEGARRGAGRGPEQAARHPDVRSGLRLRPAGDDSTTCTARRAWCATGCRSMPGGRSAALHAKATLHATRRLRR